jgi:hypothetical protein
LPKLWNFYFHSGESYAYFLLSVLLITKVGL